MGLLTLVDNADLAESLCTGITAIFKKAAHFPRATETGESPLNIFWMEIAYRKSMLDQQTSSPLKPTTITMERVLKKNSLNWRQSKGDHWHFDSNNPTPPSPLTHQPQSSGSHHHGTQRGSQSRRCVIMCPHGREPAHFSSMLGFFFPRNRGAASGEARTGMPMRRASTRGEGCVC